ncbi:MAG TPA: 3'(2'),5'-bisphosphate nucleotidase CysQ [Candidatus Binatia bacterium]|nr:3'(2'),5'-bisphosphate nucleotidase CysQ [Candidatus Binatia bacterium]
MSQDPFSTLDADLAFAIAAARSAGERVLALRTSGRWEGDVLADIGDQAADGLLQGLIRGRHPQDGLLSEETADSPERLERSRCWIVDPLDGTREFSQWRDDWAIHVALAIDGACALAAVALPSAGRLAWGVALPGRERAALEGGGRLLRGDDPGPAVPRVVVSRSHTPEWVARFCERLGAGPPEPWGSAGYKTLRILLGEADVYVHKVGLKEWDTCAPETIARALGWTVCRLRGEEHRYNRPDPRNHELVVCRPAWKERVVAALAASGASDG